MTALQDYLEGLSLGVAAFARSAGVDPARLLAFLETGGALSLAEARRLAAMSGGALVPEDFLGPDIPAGRFVDFVDRARSRAAPSRGAAIDEPALASALFSNLSGMDGAPEAELRRYCVIGAEAAANACLALDGLTTHAPDDRLSAVLPTVIAEIRRAVGSRPPVQKDRSAERVLRSYRDQEAQTAG